MRCLSILLLVFLEKAWSVVVSTKSGKVEGANRVYHGLHKNGSFFSFQGIPYAEPPTGELRFKDPVPWKESWEGNLNAAGGPPAKCPQPDVFNPSSEGGITGDENCLFLNVYTEDVSNSGSQKPVMFWIHGGGFFIGEGAQFGDGSGSDYLLESGMVVVTINYRLGPLGFLAIEGTNIQGNQGLKDQLMAMRWVKENIANFGGDPDKITIAGESAGAVSVHAQVLSPIAKDDDLFHKAISFSGTMLTMNDMHHTLSGSKDYLEHLCNVKEDEIPSNLDSSCLYSFSAQDLIKKAGGALALSKLTIKEQIEEESKDSFGGYLFFPVIDYWADKPFLPAHPITILHNQQQKMVPYMTGINKDEGAMLVAPHWKNMKPDDNQLQENWGYMGARQLFMVPVKEVTFDQKLTARMVAQFYVGTDGINRENKQGMIDMFTDAYFAYPNTETVKLHSKSPAPIYNYLMSYRGSSSFAPMFTMGDPEAAKEDFGVAHADDLMYLFKLNFGNFSTINTENDKKFVEVWQKLITEFVYNGDPSPKWLTAQNSKAACVYLDIGLEQKEKHRIFAERMEFWNKLFFADLFEQFAIDEQDNDLLEQIDSVIMDIDEDEEDNKKEKGKGGKKFRGKNQKPRRKGAWRKKKMQKMLRKQKRLAKKLKQLKCN